MIADFFRGAALDIPNTDTDIAELSNKVRRNQRQNEHLSKYVYTNM